MDEVFVFLLHLTASTLDYNLYYSMQVEHITYDCQYIVS